MNTSTKVILISPSSNRVFKIPKTIRSILTNRSYQANSNKKPHSLPKYRQNSITISILHFNIEFFIALINTKSLFILIRENAAKMTVTQIFIRHIANLRNLMANLPSLRIISIKISIC